jgi:hypothetical protein
LHLRRTSATRHLQWFTHQSAGECALLEIDPAPHTTNDWTTPSLHGRDVVGINDAEFIDISRVGEDTGSLVVSAKSLTFGLPTRGVTAGLQGVPTGSSHLDHVR